MSRARLVVMVMFILAGAVTLLVKLAQLQAVNPGRYVAQAREQRYQTEELTAPRGAILDRAMEPLVTSITRRTVAADPRLVEDPNEEAAALAPLLGRPEAELADQLRADNRFQYLARVVPDEVADRVEALGLPGVFTVPEPTRLRPAGDLALAVLGSTDTDMAGTSGIEKQYDDSLAGVGGRLVAERGRDGHTIPSGERHLELARPGSDVVLTIDRTLQHVVEQALTAQVDAVDAEAGTALVGDPRTGDILAMASVRAGGPGEPPVLNDGQNRAVTSTYEPGSVMKIVTVGAAIEAGIANENTVRKVPVSIEFAEEVFQDQGRWEEEEMTVSDIFSRSSNVGTMDLARELGEQGLADGLASFGFGVRTGVGFDQEEPGFVPAPADWWGTSLPTLAIGQSLSATALQVYAAYSALANDGVIVKPRLIGALIDGETRDVSRPEAESRRVVSSGTASQLRHMLTAAVQGDRGTGSLAQVDGYTVAGKTGTAWKVKDGGYGTGGARAYQATFAGFAPASDPAVVVVVNIDNPRSGNYAGGTAAAPVFAAIARQALVSYDVPPDDPLWIQPASGVELRAQPAKPRPTTTTAPPTTAPPTTAPPATTPATDPTASTAPGAGTTLDGTTTTTSPGGAVSPGTATPVATANPAPPPRPAGGG